MTIASSSLAENAVGDQPRGRAGASMKPPPKRRVYAKPDLKAAPEPR